MWLVDKIKALPPGRRILMAVLLLLVAAFVALGVVGVVKQTAFAKIMGLGGAVVLVPVVLLILRTPPSDPIFDSLGKFLGGVGTPVDPEQKREIDKFKEHLARTQEFMKNSGKKLYDIPWYLLIGSSSCGKTEMVRRSGLAWVVKDLANQGAGGTEFFDLWPSDSAVMIDTAGRMVNEGGQVWDQFLKQLRAARPRCPINGVILAVSSQELLNTDEQNIPSMGAKMQQKLSDIQVKLGVRFPVYIVVTKSDLITGFGALCSRIDDSDMQQQIFGWSEARPITSQPEPRLPVGEIRDLLAPVFDTVRRKRLGMLLNPGPIDASSRRIDKVDRAYELPSALEGKLARRLQRYIEAALTHNQSGSGGAAERPLFVRGIYFTTSMQEGRELDEELAKALNIPVDKLPRPEMVESTRPYFIGDLLRKKIFPEKGMVTGVANVRRYVVWRRAAILGSVLLLGLVIGLGTWGSYHQLSRDVERLVGFWKEEAAPWKSSGERPDRAELRITSSTAFSPDRVKQLVDHFPKPESEVGKESANKSIELSFPFSMLPHGYFEAQKLDMANTALIDAWVMLPLFELAESKLKNSLTLTLPGGGPAAAGASVPKNIPRDKQLEAVAELIKLEALAVAPELVTIDRKDRGADLARIVDGVRARGDAPELDVLFEKPSIKKRVQYIEKEYPPKTWGFGNERHRELKTILGNFATAWSNEFRGRATHWRLERLGELKQALLDFKTAESQLNDMARRHVESKSEFDAFKNEWNKNSESLRTKSQDAARVLVTLGVSSPTSFPDLLEKQVTKRMVDDRERETAAMLRAITPDGPSETNRAETARAGHLSDLIEAVLGTNTQDLVAAKKQWTQAADKWRETQASEWQTAGLMDLWSNGELACDSRAKPYLDAASVLNNCEKEGQDAAAMGWSTIAALPKKLLESGRAEDVALPAAVRLARRIAQRRTVGSSLDAYWEKEWPESATVAARVREAKDLAPPKDLSAVRFSVSEKQIVQPEFRPEAANLLFGNLQESTKLAAGALPIGERPIIGRSDTRTLVDRQTTYLADYIAYWTGVVKPILSPTFDAVQSDEIRLSITRDQVDIQNAIAQRRDQAIAAITTLNPDWKHDKPLPGPWTELSEDVIALLESPPQAFAASWKDASGPGSVLTMRAESLNGLVTTVAYWRGLSQTLLDRYLNSTASPVSDAIRAVTSASAKFPIDKNGREEIGVDEWKTLKPALDIIEPWSKASFADAPQALARWRELAESARKAVPSVASLETAKAAADAVWTVKFEPPPPSQPPPQQGAQPSNSVCSAFNTVQAQIDGVAAASFNCSDFFAKNPQRNDKCAVPAGAHEVTFLLLEFAAGNQRTISIPVGNGLWSVLHLLKGAAKAEVLGNEAAITYVVHPPQGDFWFALRVTAPPNCPLKEWLNGAAPGAK